MATLTLTIETPLATDPNFPTGYSNKTFIQAFDFTRNWFYQPIADGTNGGIAVTDLTTMAVVKTATLAQMYAGTAFGSPAGTPYSQGIYDIASGNNTDFYILAGATTFARRFTRVNPATMKVTGDLLPSGGVTGQLGVVNTTATHTIVAYLSLSSAEGARIYDGTGMAFVGLSAAPTYGNSNNCVVIAGAKHSDGSCDFLMLNSDYNHPTGNIDIWRIKVTDALAITSTKTGTANVLSIFPAPANLFIAQADYDTTHDTIIMQVTNSSTPAGPPVAIVSVNFNGTINWVQGPSDDIGLSFSKGQSQLTGTTMMVGNGDDLKLLDTGTGGITFTGSVFDVNASYYRVYDASRSSYWTYASSVGFARITFANGGGGGGNGGGGGGETLKLAMDNVVVTATPTLLEVNLISLRWSDDRGHAWGSPVTQDIGEAGEYRTSLQWQRMGMARDRCFEVSWSVPMRTALQGCWIDVTPAQS